MSRAVVRDDDVLRDAWPGAAAWSATRRAVIWATDAVAHDDTTVSVLARHLGVDWRNLWDAVEVEATSRVTQPDRFAGVTSLGVDERIWPDDLAARGGSATGP